LEYWSNSIVDLGMRIAELEIILYLSFINLNPKSPIRNVMTPADSCKGERPRKPPVGADQSRVLRARILYYTSAQSLDFLDLAETGNPPRRGGSESRNGTKQIPHL